MTRKKRREDKSLICGIYAQLLSGGRHHGILQTHCKVIASHWLLATFAAIGFFLSVDEILPIDHLLGVAIICLIGVSGIYLLWYEDVFVQESLLDVDVIEGLRLEKEYRWLPQMHHCFVHVFKRGNASNIKVLFFIGCKTILLTTMTIALGIYTYRINYNIMICTLIACMIFNYWCTRFMLLKTRKIDEFLRHLKNANTRNN